MGFNQSKEIALHDYPFFSKKKKKGTKLIFFVGLRQLQVFLAYLPKYKK